MNRLQFYYTHKVLGVDTVLRPSSLRSVYSLGEPLAQQTDFLFFCNTLKTSSAKVLLKNIAKALKADTEQVVKIEDFKAPNKAFLNQPARKKLSFAHKVGDRGAASGIFSFYNKVLKPEILNKNSILKNLLTRFYPKGFVIFGKELAEALISSSHLRTSTGSVTEQATGEAVLKVEKTSPFWALSFNQGTGLSNQTIPGCVIPSISQLTDPAPAKKQQAKQEAWQVLYNTFLKPDPGPKSPKK